MQIISQVKKTIEDKKLIDAGDRVLVCVSGGPDSMALLYILSGIRKRYKLQLAVAHLDHMLRGAQSRADAMFVKSAAEKLGIPLISERGKVAHIARSSKMSIEEAAREVRYAFYEKAAKKAGASKIATGHNMDDQAETVLMRLVKGAGSRGLSGIPYSRRLGNIRVIRPLLDVSRADIEGYLKKYSLPSITDATNFKTFYLRNKIRHIVLPLLEKEFNPRVKENFNLIAQNLRDEFDYMDNAARRLYNRLTSRAKTDIEINVRDLSSRHIAMQRLIVRHIILALKGDLKRIAYKHWQAIEVLLRGNNKAGVDLPEGIKVKKIDDRLVFKRGSSSQSNKDIFTESVKIKMPGETIVPELGILLKSEVVSALPRLRKRKKKRVEYLSADSIRAPLIVRTREEGDRMRPLGMKSSKKLHDIFIDEKVPRGLRDRIPLVVSGRRILWAVGVKLSEDCRVESDTRRIVKFTALSSRHVRK